MLLSKWSERTTGSFKAENMGEGRGGGGRCPRPAAFGSQKGRRVYEKKTKIERKIVGFKQMKETRGKGIEASECGSCDLL